MAHRCNESDIDTHNHRWHTGSCGGILPQPATRHVEPRTATTRHKSGEINDEMRWNRESKKKELWQQNTPVYRQMWINLKVAYRAFNRETKGMGLLFFM